ncbi:MAG: glutamate synthase subunit beta [Kiritimatiellae bacterium]|nr:glutamate synthase subunit beta [Kiritimatiellia bacterium]MDW8458870.1 glutamate synthase subunit beta [Verrucomicrobiota bacterium]
MGKVTGFKEYTRELPHKIPPSERVKFFREFYEPFPEEKVKQQAARCMDCGVPFCHTGCPLGNIIPDWNDLVYRGRWREAIDRLHATNNFPEFTGRLCPAPCEEACVLGINEPPVTIEQIEKEIIERAFAEGWVKPEPPARRTGKKIAVVGSGPAGLACAQQLNRAGHTVTVFERDDRIGGLLRYGIPDFKMEKWVVDRRLAQMEAEGIVFKPGVRVGTDITGEQLRREYDAIVLAIGATRGRDLNIPGRHLSGIHLAMEFLPQQNRIVAGDHVPNQIVATGKHVIVIGGGDTGSDCIGTAIRQGARSVTNFELLPMPPKSRPEHQPWPYYPMRLRISTSHDEGCERVFSISTKEFIGENGRVTHLKTVDVRWVPSPGGGPPKMEEVPGSEKIWPAELVLLALGFLGPETDSIVSQLGCELDARGNVKTNDHYATSVPGVFAAGDARRGQSLIVWAISEGRECARGVDQWLMGYSLLPTKVGHDLPRV